MDRAHALLKRLLRRDTVLTVETIGQVQRLAIRGGPPVRASVRQALATLQQDHGLPGAVEELRRRGRPTLRSDGYQVGLTLDARLVALLFECLPPPPEGS